MVRVRVLCCFSSCRCCGIDDPLLQGSLLEKEKIEEARPPGPLVLPWFYLGFMVPGLSYQLITPPRPPKCIERFRDCPTSSRRSCRVHRWLGQSPTVTNGGQRASTQKVFEKKNGYQVGIYLGLLTSQLALVGWQDLFGCLEWDDLEHRCRKCKNGKCTSSQGSPLACHQSRQPIESSEEMILQQDDLCNFEVLQGRPWSKDSHVAFAFSTDLGTHRAAIVPRRAKLPKRPREA